MLKFTTDETQYIIEAYKAEPTQSTIEALANQFGRTTRSIIAKLAKERVYQAKHYTDKNGNLPIKKEELVETIAKYVVVPSEALPGLEKANKSTLQRISAALAKAQASHNLI